MVEIQRRVFGRFGKNTPVGLPSEKGDVVADPFMGSGTTALVSILNGYNSLGFDILPMSKVSIQAKTLIYEYSLTELQKC